jgi:HNH endonuclease
LRPPPDKQLVLDSLAAIARGAGRPPTRSEFASLSGISEHSVLQFFPSWTAALRAAGLPPYTLNLRLEDRQLLEDWGYAARRNRKIPTRRVYRHLGKFDTRTFERRFGPWSQLPQVFRNFAHSKPEWADVLALLPAPTPKPSPKRVPNPPPHSVPSPASHSASNSAVAQALLPVRFSPSNRNSPPNRQSPSTPPPGKVRYPPLDHRPTYGQPMDFRGLRHEPVNEQGVVLLFGMVAKELGYTVEAVQSGFPDCEAKRQIAPQRWQRVHLEFEFESRNFRGHGHPVTGCDVIVCWRHNWPDCPPQIEILELSSLIKSLSTFKP